MQSFVAFVGDDVENRPIKALPTQIDNKNYGWTKHNNTLFENIYAAAEITVRFQKHVTKPWPDRKIIFCYFWVPLSWLPFTLELIHDYNWGPIAGSLDRGWGDPS